MIKDDKADVREAAIEALSQIDDERTVEMVCDSLKDVKSEIRSASALALGYIGDKRALKSLYAALSDEDPSVILAVESALKCFGKEGVEGLIPLLDIKDEKMCITAFEIIGKIGDQSSKKALFDTFRTAFDSQRYLLALRMHSLLEKPDELHAYLPKLRDAVRPVLETGSKEECNKILSFISGAHLIEWLPDVLISFGRFESIDGMYLGNYMTKFYEAALPLLREWLKSDSDYVRYQAAFAVGYLRGNGLPALKELKDALLRAKDSDSKANIEKAIDRVLHG